MMARCALLALTVVLWSSLAPAQERRVEAEVEQPAVVAPTVANAPDAGAGRVGQRQGKDTAKRAGIQPMARISNRIANRIQSRLRNRIDANYDPQANVASPFRVASEQARVAGRPR